MSNDRKHSIRDLKNKLEEYEELTERLENMHLGWKSGDPCEMACNDPGLQYELENQMERVWAEIKDEAKNISVIG